MTIGNSKDDSYLIEIFIDFGKKSCLEMINGEKVYITNITFGYVCTKITRELSFFPITLVYKTWAGAMKRKSEVLFRNQLV